MRCWHRTPPSPRRIAPETPRRARHCPEFAAAPTRACAMDCDRFRARPVDPEREKVRALRGASSTIHCKKGVPALEYGPADSGTVEPGLNFQPSIRAPLSIRRVFTIL